MPKPFTRYPIKHMTGATRIRRSLKISGLYAARVLPLPLINIYPMIINIEPIIKMT